MAGFGTTRPPELRYLEGVQGQGRLSWTERRIAFLQLHFGGRHGRLWAWLLFVLAAAPGIFAGWSHDDYMEQSMIEGHYDRFERGPGDLYCFSDGPSGVIDHDVPPWWTIANPYICFFRPLSSATLWLDHKLFYPDLAPLFHLHSLAWVALLFLAWDRLLSRYLPRDIAYFGLGMAAIAAYMTMPMTWNPTRHGTVGACLASWGLWHYCQGRDLHQIPREFVGLALMVVSLGASEMSLGIFAFAGVREYRAGRMGLRGGSKRLAVLVALVLGYVGIYFGVGYGAHVNDLYVNPFENPSVIWTHLPRRWLSVLGQSVAGVPAEALLLTPIRPLIVATGAFMLAIAGYAFHRASPQFEEADRLVLQWLGGGAALGVLPTLFGLVGGRSLTLCGFACTVVLSAVVLRGHGLRGAGLLHRLSWYFVGVGLLLAHPALRVVLTKQQFATAELEANFAEASKVECGPSPEVFVMHSRDISVTQFAQYLLYDKLRPRRWTQVVIPNGAQRIVRIDGHRLRFEVEEGSVIGGLMSNLFRAPGAEWLVGAKVETDQLVATIEAVDAQGPTRVEVRFVQPVSELCALAFDGKGLYRLELPREEGGSIVLPGTPFADAI